MLYSYGNSELSFQGNTTVIFNRNRVNENGGAVDSYLNSNIMFEGSSQVIFWNNIGKIGGALHSNSII